MRPSRRHVLWSGCAMLLAACSRSNRQDSAPSETGHGGDSSPPAPVEPCFDGMPGADWVGLSLAKYPELDALYGSAVVRIDGQEVVIAQVDKDCYVALNRSCTHEGCPIEYRDSNRFVCTCHGALFGFTGEVLGGPAPRPVDVYAVVRVDDTIWVRPTPGLE